MLADCLAHAVDAGRRAARRHRDADRRDRHGARQHARRARSATTTSGSSAVTAAGARDRRARLAPAAAPRLRRGAQVPSTADIMNVNETRKAGSITAAQFLRALHRRRAVGAPRHRRHRVGRRQAVHAEGRQRLRRAAARRARRSLSRGAASGAAASASAARSATSRPDPARRARAADAWSEPTGSAITVDPLCGDDGRPRAVAHLRLAPRRERARAGSSVAPRRGDVRVERADALIAAAREVRDAPARGHSLIALSTCRCSWKHRRRSDIRRSPAQRRSSRRRCR